MTFSDETCPNCGADIPQNAIACPECGACEETGWNETANNQSLGIDEESFDYDEFVKNEFSGSQGNSIFDQKPLIYSIIIVVITISLVFILLLF